VPGDNEKHWKPVLVVLTEKDLLIYESMPRMKEAWFSPLHTYPLLATRYLRFSITTAFYYELWEQMSQPGIGIAGAQLYITLEMLWFEKQSLLQWASGLSLTPHFSSV